MFSPPATAIVCQTCLHASRRIVSVNKCTQHIFNPYLPLETIKPLPNDNESGSPLINGEMIDLQFQGHESMLVRSDLLADALRDLRVSEQKLSPSQLAVMSETDVKITGLDQMTVRKTDAGGLLINSGRGGIQISSNHMGSKGFAAGLLTGLGRAFNQRRVLERAVSTADTAVPPSLYTTNGTNGSGNGDEADLAASAAKRRMVIAALAEHYTSQTARFNKIVIPIIMGYVGPLTVVWDCNGCGRVAYCSPTCQHTDWTAIHKYECISIRAMPPFPN